MSQTATKQADRTDSVLCLSFSLSLSLFLEVPLLHSVCVCVCVCVYVCVCTILGVCVCLLVCVCVGGLNGTLCCCVAALYRSQEFHIVRVLTHPEAQAGYKLKSTLLNY